MRSYVIIFRVLKQRTSFPDIACQGEKRAPYWMVFGGKWALCCRLVAKFFVVLVMFFLFHVNSFTAQMIMLRAHGSLPRKPERFLNAKRHTKTSPRTWVLNKWSHRRAGPTLKHTSKKRTTRTGKRKLRKSLTRASHLCRQRLVLSQAHRFGTPWWKDRTARWCPQGVQRGPGSASYGTNAKEKNQGRPSKSHTVDQRAPCISSPASSAAGKEASVSYTARADAYMAHVSPRFSFSRLLPRGFHERLRRDAW